MCLLEPPKQIPDVAIMSNTEFQEEVAPNDQINPAAPVNETEVEETEVEESDIIHSSVLVNKLNVTVSSVRTQTQETTVNLSPNDLNCDVDVEVSTKQRIRNFGKYDTRFTIKWCGLSLSFLLLILYSYELWINFYDWPPASCQPLGLLFL